MKLYYVRHAAAIAMVWSDGHTRESLEKEKMQVATQER